MYKRKTTIKKTQQHYERQWDTPVQVLKYCASPDIYTWTGDDKNGHSALAVAPESWSQSRGFLTNNNDWQ